MKHAVVMPPNVEPLDTPEKLRAFVNNFPKVEAFRISTIEIDGRTDLAFERGRYSMTVGGAADQGSHLTLWRKQSDGSWKIFRDIWHSDLAASK
jgi:ketosteroid isomerase-like protein